MVSFDCLFLLIVNFQKRENTRVITEMRKSKYTFNSKVFIKKKQQWLMQNCLVISLVKSPETYFP